MENNQELETENALACPSNDIIETVKNVEDSNRDISDQMSNEKRDSWGKRCHVNGTQKRKNASETDEENRKKKLYRLVIQIDKIRLKPGPKSEKILKARKFREKLLREFLNMKNSFHPSQILGDEENEHNHESVTVEIKKNTVRKVEIEEISIETPEIEEPIPEELSKIKKFDMEGSDPCKNSCLLENVVIRGKPLLHCLNCSRYFMPKKTESGSREKIHQCLICKRILPNPEILSQHIKQHSTCGTCGVECGTKDNLEQHGKLHIGRPPHFPVKCHLCTEVFRREEHVRSHLTNKHYMMRWVGKSEKRMETSNQIMETLIEVQHPLKSTTHRCIPCNITFRNEEAFERHVNSHKKKEIVYRNSTMEKVVQPWGISPVPLASSPMGQLHPVFFSCRICSQELTSVAEIDAHTKSHMVSNAIQVHKCNVCHLVLSSEKLLNDHVRDHLAKAQRCPICSKAFINKTSLKNHLKTHRNLR